MTTETVDRTHPGSTMVSPSKLAHFVVRTSRYAEMLAWYKYVLNAKPAFENESLAFLSYDDEHHRVAILNVPQLGEQPEGIAGIHHVAFTYDNFIDLLENYERLAERGIKPIYSINHGPTTSLYYVDPDQNQLEFQVENFATSEESGMFFFSPAFAENPIGVEIDPADLLVRLRAGESAEELKRRADVGSRDLSDVKLR
ncbi:VOC family protein [Sphingobium phenoxybenzoativorans]|uniref:VOC family protein n=1 Tax=Sphingobium phenoxybenzoativorans TaxID=1592790 RepID=UPI000AF2EBC0|nr:VOC family protein [Sphingobium phenoxybenzoativorans]